MVLRESARNVNLHGKVNLLFVNLAGKNNPNYLSGGSPNFKGSTPPGGGGEGIISGSS